MLSLAKYDTFQRIMMRTQDFNFGQKFERIFGTFKQDTIKINGSQSGTTKKTLIQQTNSL